MNGKAFFDTNVLIYAFREDGHRSGTARGLLSQGGVIGVQVLNEFVAVMRRKISMSWKEIRHAVDAICVLCPSPTPLTVETHQSALQIAERYGYRMYDALIIAAGLESNCSVLYSEDMQNGQVIEGMTIRNPFARLAV